MSHHFDSPEARADSRINITDNFLFHDPADRSKVVAITCVSPLAGLPSPYHGQLQWRTFRPTAAYDMRFDTDGDLRPDRVLRCIFSGDDAPQRVEVRWLQGAAANDDHAIGEVIGSGAVGDTITLSMPGARIWIGEAGDPFWLDAVAAKGFLDAALAGGSPPVSSFSNGQVTTAATNVLAIVADLPIALLGQRLHFNSAVSANDHGHWHQVSRCGRPNFAATFVDHPERSRAMNESMPEHDVRDFSGDVERVVSIVAANVGRVPDPAGYATRVARSLLPDVIPFDATLPSGFDFAGVNGRTLHDDFGAVVYSAVFGRPMDTAIAPLADLRASWPWVPAPRPLPGGPGVAVPTRNE
ncbi:DUF4331 family protein [Gemmatimonas groenlandica]|uniref:DUF4331 family protein n=1 Tax=Gemmatimonas groenlandica TaxID=2732249 RepID=A0A6M4IRV3_9BACT|nr:DUF4331 family protein [Gemmatimonas groenlandica]QJR37503.1 DUF4331 family protein [Gemmatimonas groenlandica]